MPIPASINDLSTTAGSNSPAGSESPSLIDDYLRTYASYIALLRDGMQGNGFSYAAAGGSANAITATYSPAITTLSDSTVLLVKAALANTGAATFSPNGLAALPIVSIGHTALVGGEIVANGDVCLQYNSSIGGGSWVLIYSTGGTQNSGRLLRTTVYINSAGTLQSSVDGAAFATASATFAKHPAAVSADVEVQGSGGGGGSANSTAAGQVAAGSGGGGGGYARKRFAIAALNGQSITVGLGSASNIAGNSSSIGILVTASGGGAGIAGANVTPTGGVYEGRPGGVGTGGDLNAQGGYGFYSILGAAAVSGKGGSSMFGDGAAPAVGVATTGAVGNTASSYGSGGSGAANGASVPTSKNGGSGASGIIIIREYA